MVVRGMALKKVEAEEGRGGRVSLLLDLSTLEGGGQGRGREEEFLENLRLAGRVISPR